MSHLSNANRALKARGADSSKGDFLPSPSGGPLVRFLEGFLLWFGCLDVPISGFGAPWQAENRIRIRFDNSSMDTADRPGAVFVSCVRSSVLRFPLEFYVPGFAKTYKAWAKNWVMHGSWCSGATTKGITWLLRQSHVSPSILIRNLAPSSRGDSQTQFPKSERIHGTGSHSKSTILERFPSQHTLKPFILTTGRYAKICKEYQRLLITSNCEKHHPSRRISHRLLTVLSYEGATAFSGALLLCAT